MTTKLTPDLLKKGIAMSDAEVLRWLAKTNAAVIKDSEIVLEDGRTIVYGSYKTIKGSKWINVKEPVKYYDYLQEAVEDRNVKFNFRAQ